MFLVKKMILGMMFYSLAAYSSNIDLKITSQIQKGNSKKSTSTSVMATLGKEFIIPVQNSDNLKLKIKVTETHPFPEATDLLFDIKILETKDGKEVTISSPKVTTVFDTIATITMDDPKKNESVSITILPSKIKQ
jgi:hypothetical protein